MKVTKAQAQANRAHIVETASRLFRERGFDGVGVADLMAAAGFTHGGFYKHFASKADLMAESTACGLASATAWTDGQDPAAFIEHYLSREHRDGRATGCAMAALGGDAARQPASVRAVFADGLEQWVASLSPPSSETGAADAAQARAQILAALTQAVGALVMSRACPDDSPLADELLAAGRHAILASLQASTPSQPARARTRRRRAG